MSVTENRRLRTRTVSLRGDAPDRTVIEGFEKPAFCEKPIDRCLDAGEHKPVCTCRLAPEHEGACTSEPGARARAERAQENRLMTAPSLDAILNAADEATAETRAAVERIRNRASQSAPQTAPSEAPPREAPMTGLYERAVWALARAWGVSADVAALRLGYDLPETPLPDTPSVHATIRYDGQVMVVGCSGCTWSVMRDHAYPRLIDFIAHGVRTHRDTRLDPTPRLI